MTAKRFREIAVAGMCAPSMRKRVVEGISLSTPHSLVLDADLESCGPTTLARSGPIQRISVHGKRTAILHPEACTDCGRCVRVCPTGAILRVDGRIKIDSSRCTACGGCVEVCARGGVALDEPMLAWFQVSASAHGRVVHGQLDRAGVVDLDLVQRLRQHALREAALFGMETMVVDLPWNSGDLFERVVDSCDERIVVVEDSFRSVVQAMRLRETWSGWHGSVRLAISTDDERGFRYLTEAEIEASEMLAGHELEDVR
jgi:MinD superfamily P-loop ATPase